MGVAKKAPEGFMTERWKTRARIGLVVIAVVSVWAGWRASQIGFNYDFESFFPEGQPETEFYMAFREAFSTDNDFALVGSTLAEVSLTHPVGRGRPPGHCTQKSPRRHRRDITDQHHLAGQGPCTGHGVSAPLPALALPPTCTLQRTAAIHLVAATAMGRHPVTESRRPRPCAGPQPVRQKAMLSKARLR